QTEKRRYACPEGGGRFPSGQGNGYSGHGAGAGRDSQYFVYALFQVGFRAGSPLYALLPYGLALEAGGDGRGNCLEVRDAGRYDGGSRSDGGSSADRHGG